jgi:formate dehydrogenase subunit gamma
MHVSRRALVAVAIAVAFALGIAYAFRVAAVEGSELLFDSGWWLVALAPFAGVFAAGLTKRKDPVIEGDRVLRHDGPAILEHWTHGIGTAVLLVSGIMLGLFFVPAVVGSGAPLWTAMNVHFVAVVMFLFGTFYYAANTLISTKRFGEHLPTKNAFKFTVQHYGHLLGIKKYSMPPEDKYFESEKMAYLLALGATALIILTGLFKAAAHVVDLPAGLMGAMTLVHDVATVAMLAFFLAHVFFGAILPMSWPVLGSMFTGYVSKEQAQKEHAGWYRRLTGGSDAFE